jgi:hypothetical protein
LRRHPDSIDDGAPIRLHDGRPGYLIAALLAAGDVVVRRQQLDAGKAAYPIFCELIRAQMLHDSPLTFPQLSQQRVPENSLHKYRTQKNTEYWLRFLISFPSQPERKHSLAALGRAAAARLDEG